MRASRATVTDQSTGPFTCCSGRILKEIGTDVVEGSNARPSSSNGITGTMVTVSAVTFNTGAASKTIAVNNNYNKQYIVTKYCTQN